MELYEQPACDRCDDEGTIRNPCAFCGTSGLDRRDPPGECRECSGTGLRVSACSCHAGRQIRDSERWL